MIRSSFLTILLLVLAGCAPNAQRVEQNSNAASEPMRAEKLQSVTQHSTENQQPPSTVSNNSTAGGESKWAQGGEAIETAKFDQAISAAEKNLRARPADESAKKAAAQAYFERGFALTEARQYASAIGDYRRALKHDPNDAESKKWIDQIIAIYAMLKKQAPKEGEEPPPLAWKKSYS